MGTDLVHHGHINIIEKARELGEVTVGLLSDEAVTKFSRIPFLEYEERKRILENIKGVKEVPDLTGIEESSEGGKKYGQEENATSFISCAPVNEKMKRQNNQTKAISRVNLYKEKV